MVHSAGFTWSLVLADWFPSAMPSDSLNGSRTVGQCTGPEIDNKTARSDPTTEIYHAENKTTKSL